MQTIGITGLSLDAATAASSTAAQPFIGVFVPSTTLTATNTNVTTSTASSLVIAGPPTFGTNQTVTTLYALNVQSGNAYFGGNIYLNNYLYRSALQRYSGRYFLNAKWTPASGWNYLPNSFSLAADLPPSNNAVVSATNGTTLNLNTSTGLFFLPVSGTWAFNMAAFNVSSVSTTNPYEIRFNTYSAPAWTTGGSGAKSYGTSQTASTLSGLAGAQLASTALVTVNESGLFYMGDFPAGTMIAAIVYSGSGSMYFNSSGLYFDVNLINAMV